MSVYNLHKCIKCLLKIFRKFHQAYLTSRIGVHDLACGVLKKFCNNWFKCHNEVFHGYNRTLCTLAPIETTILWHFKDDYICIIYCSTVSSILIFNYANAVCYLRERRGS